MADQLRPFNPQDHVIELKRNQKKKDSKGRDYYEEVITEYLPVQWRIAWFRHENPKGKIESKPIHIDYEKGEAVFETYAEREDGGFAIMHGSETRADWKDWLEKAQTKSIGRTLSALGYGSQFHDPEFDEQERIADSPVIPTQNSISPQSQVEPNPPTAQDAEPEDKVIATITKQGPDPVHQRLVAAFKRCITPEEWKAFLSYAKITKPTKDWTFDIYKSAYEGIGKYLITSSMKEALGRAMATYGKAAVTNMLRRIPEMKGKTFDHMPAPIGIQVLHIVGRNARFYQELLTVYDPDMTFLRVTLKEDSILNLFINPEKEKLQGSIYTHITKLVSKDQKPLAKLADDFKEMFKEELKGLVTTAQSLKPTEQEQPAA